MSGYDHEFLDRTRQLWQQHADRKLSRDDAREIADNFAGLFELLLRWDRNEHERDNDTEHTRAAEEEDDR